jgi:hypothetical protein
MSIQKGFSFERYALDLDLAETAINSQSRLLQLVVGESSRFHIKACIHDLMEHMQRVFLLKLKVPHAVTFM